MNMIFFNFKGVSQNKMNEFNNINNFNQKQNIMKKSILLLAVAASFAACTQNEEINDAISQQEIKFDQVLNKTTKAEIVDKAALASEGGFAVFGYKSIDEFVDNTTTVFDNVNVYDDNGAWKYTDKKYWDKTATYNFYAIAPYESSATYSLKDGKFTVDGVASGLATASEDYVIDRTPADECSISGAGTPSTVGFEFHHIMAKLSFAVKTNLEGSVIKVQSLTMTGWNNGAGKFVQTKTDGTWEELNASEWTIATAGAGSATLIGAGSGNTEAVTLSSEATALTDKYIMVPQTIAAETLTFTVNYTIDDEPFVNQVSALSTAQTWGTDSHTTYTLTIGPAAIEFDVESVCDFCYTAPGQNPSVQ